MESPGEQSQRENARFLSDPTFEDTGTLLRESRDIQAGCRLRNWTLWERERLLTSSTARAASTLPRRCRTSQDHSYRRVVKMAQGCNIYAAYSI